MVDDHHPDDDQPEEGVGVQVACAHHDHVHLCSAAILDKNFHCFALSFEFIFADS